MELVRSNLIIIATLCLPILSIATIVGVLVAIVQAATQIQEQTLPVLPKLIAVGLTIALFGHFGLGLCAELFGEAIRAIPRLVGG